MQAVQQRLPAIEVDNDRVAAEYIPSSSMLASFFIVYCILVVSCNCEIRLVSISARIAHGEAIAEFISDR